MSSDTQNKQFFEHAARDTGGSAFPITEQNGANSGDCGMTLRQYYASHCPITWEDAKQYNDGNENEMEFYAAIRWEYADKMIAAERAK